MPPSGGTRRRIGAQKPERQRVEHVRRSGPSGATQDRIACAMTTMISSQSVALTSSTPGEQGERRAPSRRRTHRDRASELAARPATRTRRPRRAAASNRRCPWKPGTTRRTGLTAQSVSGDHRLPERIAERRAQPLHREAQQERVGEEPERGVEQKTERLVEHASDVLAEGVAELAGAQRGGLHRGDDLRLDRVGFQRRDARARWCRLSTSPARAASQAPPGSPSPARSPRRTSRRRACARQPTQSPDHARRPRAPRESRTRTPVRCPRRR